MKTITYKKLLKIENPLIIDIRTSKEYQNHHIDNVLNIENNDLIIKYEKYLNKENTYYLICNTGVTSKETAAFLKKFGYDAISVKKGYRNFKQP